MLGAAGRRPGPLLDPRRGAGTGRSLCREGPRGERKRHEGDGRGFRCCEVELVGGRSRLVVRGPRRGRNRIGGWNC